MYRYLSENEQYSFDITVTELYQDKRKAMIMKMNKLNGAVRAGAAILIAGVLSGCSVKFGTRREPKSDLVVAHPTSGENAEDMDITYGMFSKEYRYFLVNSGIEDDTDEMLASYCTSQRESIIDYLINEQLILCKAREMGLYDLTEEEMAEVDADMESRIGQQVDYYGTVAAQAAENGETLTDEEKQELGNQKLEEVLKKCGMTRDDIHWWAQSSKITEKLRTALGDAVPYSRAEEEFKGVQELARDLYNNDMTTYSMGGYDQIWLPEGSRLIKHILIGFDDDTQSELSELRKNGSDDEADKKRAEAAEKLKEKQKEIEEKLDAGSSIDELIKEYSADAEGSAANPDGYTVIPDLQTYMEEFQKAAFVPEKIGDRTTCVTDYGVHIMVYAGDAKISAEAVKDYTEYLHEQLRYKEFSDKMKEWADEYAFEIDYEALRLDAPKKSADVLD